VESEALKLDAAAALVRSRDTLLCGFLSGQPSGLLTALGERSDLEDVILYCGLLGQPYALLSNPAVRVVSGFFGPIERMARSAGARIAYLPADFHGLERLALRMKPRVVLAVTTPPDADGWLSFGLHAGASYRPFVEAARDPERLAIAEINSRMPRLGGWPELGDNRIHLSEVDAWVEHESELVTLPPEAPTTADLAIAASVCDRIEPASILQFGIGALPDAIATRLAAGAAGGFGIHTEMISEGVMRLHEAGKVSNEKPLYGGCTVATFALGSRELYDWLGRSGFVRMLPVSAVNEPSLLRLLPRFVSINGALAIDLSGQVSADRVTGRQYSGVGGHESFVTGASEAPGGQSFLCLKSTATVHGTTVSTIVPSLAPGATVTTPRHHVQWVVTEHGAADLSTMTDEERAQALIAIAHPDFRAELRRSFEAPRA
jgi:acyl-CoA hydrolase